MPGTISRVSSLSVNETCNFDALISIANGFCPSYCGRSVGMRLERLRYFVGSWAD